MLPDEESHLIIGWDKLSSHDLLDLFKSVRKWVDNGFDTRTNLCDDYECRSTCPAHIVHCQSEWMVSNSSLCDTMDAKVLTAEELLELVEHEMDKRGMSYVPR